MLEWLTRRKRQRRIARSLYELIVALSRQPELYARIGVPDTVEGRFELLVLHLFLILERLSGADARDAALSQQLVDEFFADMDTTNRELGVGDLAVPKKMRRLVVAYRQRIDDYKIAMEEGKSAMAVTLESNFEENALGRKSAQRLAAYAEALREIIARNSIDDLDAGNVENIIPNSIYASGDRYR